MPSRLPETSANKGHVLIAALSGRSLAEAARQAGYAPLVADLFGDLDTREIADAVEVVEGDFASGFKPQALLDALAQLADGRRPIGLVYSSGFEGNPGLLTAISSRWTLLGNAAETVVRLKDPMEFASLCARFDIPHPETVTAPPGDPASWLSKRRGGSGGGHIRGASARHDDKRYFQRRIDGVPASALFAADGTRMRVIGWSRQWSSPSPDEPYRYGGAARPCGLPDAVLQSCEFEIAALTAAFKLKGLNSADYIFAGERHWLLEINPRPGAALDVFQGFGLFDIHIAACRGELLDASAGKSGASAAAIVYANTTVASVPAIAWPDWTRDRQRMGTKVGAGEPLCTVMAEASDVMDAIAMAQARIHLMRGKLEVRVA
jgi:predicted ATP-grasp superfamily ATP-dependent carboligase